LGKVVSDAGMKQLRIAETEKYAHVTFFFNGGEENIYPGEERILVPSPKVATYDLRPEMSAHEVTNNLVDVIKAEQFDIIIVNYANGDMVGHTGVFDAAVKAAETIDQCLKRIEEALLKVDGVMLVTADHGNVEQMNDPQTQGPHTAHTLSPVPLILVNPPSFAEGLREGVLADVSPTLLQLLDLDQPDEMSGCSLIIEKKAANGTT
jgi:2,3-bisphosphoglycerate-independent phosphoglycerate mutase